MHDNDPVLDGDALDDPSLDTTDLSEYAAKAHAAPAFLENQLRQAGTLGPERRAHDYRPTETTRPPEKRRPVHRLVFESTRHLDPDEQAIVKHLIEAILLKHEARRWTTIAS